MRIPYEVIMNAQLVTLVITRMSPIKTFDLLLLIFNLLLLCQVVHKVFSLGFSRDASNIQVDIASNIQVVPLIIRIYSL